MNEKPFISIIVPYYNTPEKFFRRCVDSVRHQTYENYEMIVVDDGSSQEHKEMLDELADANSKIRVIHKENEGVSVARNIGVQSAQYDYIMFLDSDDAITKYCLEEAAEVIVKEEPDLVLGLVKKANEDEIDNLKVIRETPNQLRIDSFIGKERLVSHLLGYMNDELLFCDGYIADGPVAKVLKKSIAVESVFPKEALWDEDTLWNLKVIWNCESIYLIGSIWYKYLINRTSSTQRFRPNCPYEFDYITKEELDIIKELWPNCLQGIYHKIFNVFGILCRTFLFHPENPKSSKEKYRLYINCIHRESYREVLDGISFHRENRIAYRVVKEILRFCSYYGPHIVSYWILGMYYRFKRNS